MVYRYVKNFRNASLIQLDFWKFLKNMNQASVININSPFLDQKPGTSGLRKSTVKFQEEHYLEIVIGTTSGNVNAPNKGVKATILFNINLIC